MLMVSDNFTDDVVWVVLVQVRAKLLCHVQLCVANRHTQETWASNDFMGWTVHGVMVQMSGLGMA